jgi:hypothetical protein
MGGKKKLGIKQMEKQQVKTDEDKAAKDAKKNLTSLRVLHFFAAKSLVRLAATSKRCAFTEAPHPLGNTVPPCDFFQSRNL